MSGEIFHNKKFKYLNIRGDIYADELILLPHGKIAGYEHHNESSWSADGGRLYFHAPDGTITTSFIYNLRLDDRQLLLGSFAFGLNPDAIWHALWETPPLIVAERNTIHYMERSFHNIRQTINLISRNLNLAVSPKTMKAAFIVHNMNAWDSIADVVEAMRAAPDFDPIVIAAPGNHQSEEDIHKALNALGIPHIRPCLGDPWEALNILKSISPDITFKQTPWEHETLPSFVAEEINFSRICYIPYYGFNLLEQFGTSAEDEFDMYSDQPFHRLCWRIFAESDDVANKMRNKAPRTVDNIVVTGHPKLDRLASRSSSPEWPIDRSLECRPFRLIWAPHWSITGDWLSFGTFLDVHEDMVRWATEDRDIEIILKPHPGLFASIPADVRESFLATWSSLDNVSISTGGNYGSLLAGSDAMVTDGISFLAEYQLFDKPLIFIDSGRHAPFNELGERVVEATWQVRDVVGARSFVDLLRASSDGVSARIRENDPTAGARRRVAPLLRPYPDQACRRILDEIRAGLHREAGEDDL